MTDEEDRKRMDGVISAISALQAGERHALEDRETLRKEIRASERRLAEDISEVQKECELFRAEVRLQWRTDREEAEKRKMSGRTVVVAVIAASATVLASIVAAAAAILTGGA